MKSIENDLFYPSWIQGLAPWKDLGGVFSSIVFNFLRLVDEKLNLFSTRKDKKLKKEGETKTIRINENLRSAR